MCGVALTKKTQADDVQSHQAVIVRCCLMFSRKGGSGTETLEGRKKAILKAIVEMYIQTGEPVGSKVLSGVLPSAASPATVRAEMAALGALGYLEQPHTSAGRVPTAKAYRLYIEQLMPRRAPGQERRADIDRRLSSAGGDPQLLLSAASRLLSESTGCAALATPPTEPESTLAAVELVRLSPRGVMAAVLTSCGTLRSRMCRVDESVSDSQVSALAGELNRALCGKPLCRITPAAVQTLLTRLEGGLDLAGVATAVYDMCSEEEGEVRLSGQWQLWENPDYSFEYLRRLAGFLSRGERLRGMLADLRDGLQILLDGESLFPELAGSCVIVARYSPGSRVSGAIGIIGPVRMDYSRAIPQLEYTAYTVGRLMADLWQR